MAMCIKDAVISMGVENNDLLLFIFHSINPDKIMVTSDNIKMELYTTGNTEGVKKAGNFSSRQISAICLDIKETAVA